jgi:acyl-homoserine-lactone acylase
MFRSRYGRQVVRHIVVGDLRVQQEFGPRLRAWAVTAGGVSGHPDSPHFDDQAERYASGNLRPVYFYPDDLEGHIERRYRPGR